MIWEQAAIVAIVSGGTSLTGKIVFDWLRNGRRNGNGNGTADLSKLIGLRLSSLVGVLERIEEQLLHSNKIFAQELNFVKDLNQNLVYKVDNVTHIVRQNKQLLEGSAIGGADDEI